MEGDDVVVGALATEERDVAVPNDRAVKNGAVEGKPAFDDNLSTMPLQPFDVFIVLSCYDCNLDALYGEVNQMGHDWRIASRLDFGAGDNDASLNM